MKTKLGVVLMTIVAVTCVALAQRRTNNVNGPDDRPNYYKSLGVSMWPYEMKNTARHGKGRVWIDVFPNGAGESDASGSRTVEEELDIVLWSHVAVESIRVFNLKTSQLLLAKDGNELLTCAKNKGTLTFPKRYIICSIDIPPLDAVLGVEVTDTNVNTFEYSLPVSKMAAEIKHNHDWLNKPN
jgi:hypothetical protein